MNEPHKWEFRPPPGGDVGEELVICRDKEMCRLGVMCPAAHSARELEEWKKRKQEQIRKQIQKGTYSDRILKEIFSESSSLPPMSTSLPGVKVVCDMKENLKFVTRNSSAVWCYHLSSHLFLKGISLLHVENLTSC
ncbi:probable helicase with zinc finger domain [Eurytemora carolleeae]|uniref:probable helicase with zinc finger domain n=1 Tax=Eurytemora carolleeae TaxID=1294199 RepID=UPI000C7735E3|nr:probable helicase with zinc finger domain [Eurytemora carolleeae]|eukprot:XP_023348703.1 probable helicase with zinc finger domain [Eurytemora affinis]